MGSISAYVTSSGKRYRVIYRKPDHSQTQKRGFKTKRDAELLLANMEVDKSRGANVDPSKSRVLLGEWLDNWMAGRSHWQPTSRERARGIVAIHIKPSWANTRSALGRRRAVTGEPRRLVRAQTGK